MLSEDEKRDLLDGAHSASTRRDFQILRRNSAPKDPRNMSIPALVDFLEAALRLSGPGRRDDVKIDYPRPLI